MQFAKLKQKLAVTPATWLVTGVAGFVGSNLLEELLRQDQRVVGLDNLSTGRRPNLDQVQSAVTEQQWSRFRFLQGDIRDLEVCRDACSGVDYVLHQAALGSVPRSLKDPISTHDSNVSGFVNMLVAARDSGVAGFVYASSSSAYGDHPALPKRESVTGNILSPYAATKVANESYAGVFARCYGLRVVGLRYFNVFGPRQDPESAYAAVVPRWTAALIREEPITVYGDGETSRDFCYVANVVQANMLAATATNLSGAVGHIFNVAVGGRTSLNELLDLLVHTLSELGVAVSPNVHRLDFRPGDIRHSQADISRARDELGYEPTHMIADGLREAVPWYVHNFR